MRDGAAPLSRVERARAIAGSLVWPAVIVVAVVVVMHDFAFGRNVKGGDILDFFAPNHCFLGTSLRAGHVPAWNPFSMAGVPFAADPQAGWLHMPAMLLYTALPCGGAAPALVVLQPILAGLGLFAFLRVEGVSRPAAALGGLALGVGTAGSTMVLSMPFAGTLAWTPWLLAAAGKALRSPRWAPRLGWTAAAALAWGQLATAHASDGLFLGTAALVAYAGAGMWTAVRREGRTARSFLSGAGVLLAALPLVNLAILAPRLAYLPRTSIALGYAEMDAISRVLTGSVARELPIGHAAHPEWIAKLAASPGLYLGAAVLALATGAWASRRHRPLVVALAVLAGVGYVVSLRVVAAALEPVVRALPFGDVYLHNPARFRLVTILVIPALAAFGAEAYREAGLGRRRLAIALPGAVGWAAVALAAGVSASHLVLFSAGAVAAAATLALWAWRPALAWMLPAVVAMELTANGLIGAAAGSVAAGVPGPGVGGPFTSPPLLALGRTNLRLESFVPGGGVLDRLRADRGARYVVRADRRADPRVAADGFAALLRIENAQGYNPVQVRRYWRFVRAASDSAMPYNVSILIDPVPSAADLLNVRYVVVRRGRPPPDGTRVGTSRRRRLYAVPGPPRATVVGRWEVVDGEEAAIDAATQPAFDPSEVVLLEEDPGLERGGGSGTATFRWLGTQEASIDVDADGPALVLIRIPFDPNWRATVDGRAASVLPADGVVQAVPVTAGRHRVVLRYDDPWVGRGLIGSAVVLVALAGVAFGLAARDRRAPGSSPGGAEGSDLHPRQEDAS